MADPQTPTRQNVLTLDTLIDRKTVTIDGREYELRPIDDLPLFDYQRLIRFGERVDVLIHATGEPTPEQEREFNALMDELMGFAFEEPPPPDVMKRLGTRKRLAIWRVFQTLSPSSLPSAGSASPGEASVDLSTTSSSSPDSPGSMPAPPPVTG